VGQAGRIAATTRRAARLPNGATPLDNGDVLVSEIRDAWITRHLARGEGRLEREGANIRYPSARFRPSTGKNVIVADFWSRPAW